MGKRELADELVTGLGRAMGLDGLSLDDQTRGCVLLFDGDIIVNLEFDEATGRLVFSAYLGELPMAGAEAALRELMAANLYWHRTQGATLSLEEGTGGIILGYAHSVTDLSEAGAEAVLENFVNRAEHWSRRLGRMRESSAHVDQPISDDTAMMILP